MIHQVSIEQNDNQTESNEIDYFDLNELMDLAEAYVGPMIDAIFRRLMDRGFALEDPEVVMLLVALIIITEVLLMAAYGEGGLLERPNMRVMRGETGLSQGVTWRTRLSWEVPGPTNQVRCFCQPSLGLV